MKKKKDLKYTLERLYKCRDLEITNLWQRSVFLSVFMLLCFSGYGYLLDKLVTVDDATYYELLAIKKDSTFIENIDSLAQSIKKGKDAYVLKIENLKANNNPIPINNLKIKQSVKLELKNYNLVAVGIALIGIVFSVLWIAMAKGSKAWYEVYEIAIGNLEYDNYIKLGIPENYRMGFMFLPKDRKDNCLLSPKSGAYSPSKINIAIGQVSLLIWIVIAIIHLTNYIIYVYHIELIPFQLGKACSVIIPIVLFIFLIKQIICRLLKHVGSSFLDINSLFEKNIKKEEEKNRATDNKRSLLEKILCCKS